MSTGLSEPTKHTFSITHGSSIHPHFNVMLYPCHGIPQQRSSAHSSQSGMPTADGYPHFFAHNLDYPLIHCFSNADGQRPTNPFIFAPWTMEHNIPRVSRSCGRVPSNNALRRSNEPVSSWCLHTARHYACKEPRCQDIPISKCCLLCMPLPQITTHARIFETSNLNCGQDQSSKPLHIMARFAIRIR